MRLELPDDAASLTDAVVAAVRDGVQRGELVPGPTYSVYRLADALGTSRSPVREAVLRLAEVGLVEIARNRGFRVVVPGAREVEEIFEVRLALEPPAAARAAERGCPDAADLLATMAAAATAGDEPAFWAADRALHHALLVAAGNRRAAGIVEQLRATTALLGPPTTATGRTLAEIHAEHAPIVAAVAAGDPDAAAAAMRDHLRRTAALLAREGAGTPVT
ncbi:GntR family transcriptional regulator [Nocardioides litoris]|uniref:GntR family transcriptional regulator n=1 Tax=Nocardioides litoris TaxID=1926648 RepID=UPI001B878EF6|nr:GntR family transcriptional regulator [Nocardioides litoris]